MDDIVSPLGSYIVGAAASEARKRYGPGMAVRLGGVWCWPALTDDEIYRDPWL